jgi:glycerol-3-phosphate acyltransferase PlsY
MYILSLILGYLFGSIPSAVIFTRMKGVNILEIGDGNPGAANVWREIGKIPGIVVWALDTLKVIIPMFIADRVFGIKEYPLIMVGTTAIVGHCLPLFNGFKGGRGLATIGGIILYIAPKLFLIGAVLYLARYPVKKGFFWWLTAILGLLVFCLLVKPLYPKDYVWIAYGLITALVIVILVNILKSAIKKKAI